MNKNKQGEAESLHHEHTVVLEHETCAQSNLLTCTEMKTTPFCTCHTHVVNLSIVEYEYRHLTQQQQQQQFNVIL